MADYPFSNVCPECGSDDYFRRRAVRECRACRTRYRPPTPPWQRKVVGLGLITAGLALCGAASWAFVMMTSVFPEPKGGGRDPTSYLCCGGPFGVMGIVGLLCAGRGLKELLKQPEPTVPAPGSPDGPPIPEERVTLIVPRGEAESLLREIAERHGAEGILRKLGRIRLGHVENAVATFARLCGDREVPLLLADTSFLRNGKAGLLLTNRRLYSSLTAPFELAEIRDVAVVTPSSADALVPWIILVVSVVCQPLGALLALYFLSSDGIRNLQYRLVVNSVVAYSSGNPIRGEFWIEALTSLGRAARGEAKVGHDTEKAVPEKTGPTAEAPDAHAITRHVGLFAESPGSAGPPPRPATTALETIPHGPDGDPVAAEVLDNPPWEQIEQSIRELNRHTHPVVRLWAGEPEEAPGLEIIGGNGTYALREVGDGWVYYDPSGGEEEVVLQTSGEGYRSPAYYVCTDLDEVLRIARRFFGTGRFEESG